MVILVVGVILWRSLISILYLQHYLRNHKNYSDSIVPVGSSASLLWLLSSCVWSFSSGKNMSNVWTQEGLKGQMRSQWAYKCLGLVSCTVTDLIFVIIIVLTNILFTIHFLFKLLFFSCMKCFPFYMYTITKSGT